MHEGPSKIGGPAIPASFSAGLRQSIGSYFDTAAPALELPAGAKNILELINGKSATLLWKGEQERAEALIFAFAQRGVPQQVFRWTGWAGNIKNEKHDYTPGLNKVIDGFRGVNGFHLFGGTQTRKLSDGSLIPNCCDIPATLNIINPDIILIGVIPKVKEEPKYIPKLGIVLSCNEDKNMFTVINPNQDIGIVLQPDVNGHYEWIDEIKESLRISSKLADKGWATNLVVYGGSTSSDTDRKLSNVEQEVNWWCKMAQEKPDANINILLIRGSGGVADKYANDQDFLKKNPCIKVVELDQTSIQQGVTELKGVVVSKD